MKIYFLGIGGIGVSALARYYHKTGNNVSGEDLTRSEITDGLIKDGIRVRIRTKFSIFNFQFSKYDLLVYSPAVPKDNPILTSAIKEGIKCQSYPEVLGELTKKYWTIAICGTHGKSTTTSMIGLMLSRAGLDPTVIVGTKLKEFNNSNCRIGKSKFLVIEADEHMGSFLNYWPQVIVLTRIDRDHLDYYKNLANIKNAFKKFIGHLPSGGVLVANNDDENINKLITNYQLPIFPPKADPPQADNKFSINQYSIKDREAKTLKQILKIPGDYNISNALAAYRIGQLLKVPKEKCLKALSEYHGAWRRFEEHSLKIKNKQGKNVKFQIISDYGHHPTEVEVTLKAAREKYPNKKIWCVFQPHQYQRTYYLFKDFIRVLSQAPVNKLIIIDIYGVTGRENNKIQKKVNSDILVKKIQNKVNANRYLSKNNTLYIKDIKQAYRYLAKNIIGGEVLVIMGAGDVYDLAKLLIRNKS